MIPRQDAEATGRALWGGSARGARAGVEAEKVLRLIPRAAGEIISGPPAGRPGPLGAIHRTNGKGIP